VCRQDELNIKVFRLLSCEIDPVFMNKDSTEYALSVRYPFVYQADSISADATQVLAFYRVKPV